MLKGLFGGGPLSQRKIDKAAKLASNPYAQPDVRMKEMQRLLHDGSEAAYRGLLLRFAANANGQIADEEEKQWLENAVADVGVAIQSPLRNFIRENKSLSYALRAYERSFGAEEAVRFFLEVLEHHGPESYRQSEAKQQLVMALAEHLSQSGVLAGLVPFAEDHSDDVRWAVLDGLERALDDGSLGDELKASYGEVLARILRDDSTGPRVQRRVAELVNARGWAMPLDEGEVCPLLDENYVVDKKGFVRLRARPS